MLRNKIKYLWEGIIIQSAPELLTKEFEKKNLSGKLA